MPYYRRRVRRSYSRRSRIPPVGSYVNARTGRYYRGSSRLRQAKRQLGYRRPGPANSPGQIYRVVLPTVTNVMIGNGTASTVAAYSTTAAVDLLSAVYTSGNFGAAVTSRFGAWRVRGYSITRMFMASDFNPVQSATEAPAPGFFQIVYRIDKDSKYNSPVGLACTDMMNYQDSRFRLIAAGESMRPLSITVKVMAPPNQLHVMDTAIAPAVDPNSDYWSAAFTWAMFAPGVLSADLAITYRDVVEVLYDGLEAKY